MTSKNGSVSTDGSSLPNETTTFVGQVLRNPYFTMVVWILIGTCLVSLRWSVLFASLRLDLMIFLALVVAVFLWLAATGVSSPSRRFAPVSLAPVVLVTCYFAVAVAYSGGIPVLLIASGQAYDIYSFGIPGLHIAALSFTGYYMLRVFRQLLVSGDRRWLMVYLWLLTLVGSMGSRSAISFILFGCAILFLRGRRVTIRRAVLGAGCLVFFLMLFGLFGDVRLEQQVAQDTGQGASDDAILSYSRASAEFYGTGLPATWLWPYMYMASPVANLNSAFEQSSTGICGEDCDIVGLAIYEMMPDVVGLRLGSTLGVDEYDKNEFLIAPEITASTTFGSAVGYAGFTGAFLVAGILVTLVMVVSRYLRHTPFLEEGVAILSTILFFSFFENMLAYSPLSLQLLWVAIAAKRYRTGKRSNSLAAR